MAGCALATGAAHLLLAQLTLVLAVAFAVAGKASRWRRSWLLVPAAAGVAWTLVLGPDKALAGFAAGPAGILWHLGGGHLTGEAGHPLAGFDGIQRWLPRQFPVALVTGAAEAALVGWLDWLHTDEWAVPPPRPGLIAVTRRALAARRIRSGAVVTRDGCALGVVPSTGAAAELRWAELARGALVAGSARHDVTLTGLQVVHAALRRRKPVVVLDPGDPAIATAVAAACQATGTPLVAGNGADTAGRTVQAPAPMAAGTGAPGASDPETAGASRLWGRGASQRAGPAGGAAPALADPADRVPVDLARVVRDRLAALLPADSAELSSRACADLAALAADLQRIGVDADTLVWVPRGELVPAQALAAFLRDSAGAGLAVLVGATSSATAAELCGLAGTVLSYRVANRVLADRLAARTGTRLLPAPAAAARAGQRPDAHHWPAAPAPGAAAPAGLSTASSGALPPAAAPVATVATAPDLVPSPAIPAPALLALGRGEFVLAVSSPLRRLIAVGRMVPARLPGEPR